MAFLTLHKLQILEQWSTMDITVGCQSPKVALRTDSLTHVNITNFR